MKRITFHEDARAELAEASHYYEDRVSGLGYALIDEVEQGSDAVAEHPEAYEKVSDNLRRKVLAKFPYRHNVCQLKKKDSPLANVG